MTPELDLIVFIKCSGANVREDNLTDTIVSFAKKNIGCNYGFYITVDPHMEMCVNKIFRDQQYKDILNHRALLELKVSQKSWAIDFNEFFDKYQNKTKWILISHDDVEYITDNYFTKIMDSIRGHEEKIGWITSTSAYYYEEEGKVITDTFRVTGYEDYDNWGAMFQLHKMAHLKQAAPKVVTKNLHLIDMPSSPVKVHGIMSAIMLVSVESLRKIGYCEDWTNYTMLIDEDWSLEALKNKLWNVWVPDVFHRHPLRRLLRPTHNKWQREAERGFLEKWGYGMGKVERGMTISINELREQFAGTNIPWSTYRKSYDWESLDD